MSTDIKPCPFVIKIDDGFVEFQFGFDHPNADNICVADIVDAILEKFNVEKMVYGFNTQTKI